MVATEWID